MFASGPDNGELLARIDVIVLCEAGTDEVMRLLLRARGINLDSVVLESSAFTVV